MAMFKKFIKLFTVIVVLSLALVACGNKQKKTDVVRQKERAQDFIAPGATIKPAKKVVPELPGKAQILGAPIPDVSTTTGQATVAPQSALPAPQPPSPPAPAKKPSSTD